MMSQVCHFFSESIFLLEIAKITLLIGGIAFATSFMIPKGINLYFEWKEKRTPSLLRSSISYIATGILLLLYILALFIIDFLNRS